ncbi:hypothetical protein F7725_002367 [Dissostichus mawsoni]|uniref:TRASH domain-containing protein n=1 Tax=Dissostichus mawsoni TaxID=36200 RepID=A0A7J5Y5B7_DISMA|nr:hypothetical protein F7725_002367 [Dissostichus mawsoni]
MPKPPGQSSSNTSSSGSQPQARTVKVTCANCKKPLKKGQTAYQRKGSTHLFCSTTCLSAFSHKPAPKKSCTMCKKSTANHFLLVDGQQKRFCCQNCIRDFKQANSKLASCLTCKTLIKTGEVLHSLGASGTMGSYCSVNCMNKSKIASTSFIASEPTCHFCKRNSLPQYQATLSEGNILNFCSSQCVTKFQNTTIQTATNGQTALSTRNNSVQLKCNYCRGAFSLRPEVLEWEEKAYQFCSKTCCEDYKKLHCIVTFCEYCQEEKTLHEMVKFSGVKRPFCSEGCKLLFKQDFIKRLGLKCVSCNHCSQLCKRGLTRQLGGMTRDFCSEACAKKFHDWYHKGSLTESVMWREEMKQFCDQDCLLKSHISFECLYSFPWHVADGESGHSAYAGGGLMRDVKNKAVLCKPLTLTKATYCKPHMQSNSYRQGVYSCTDTCACLHPVPMNMYSQFTPTPFTLPVPVPVPVFLPTTLQGAEQLIQTFKDLKREAPSDPPEADKLSEVEGASREEGSNSSSEEEEEKDEEKNEDEDMEEEKAEEKEKEEEKEEEEEKKEDEEKNEQEKEEEMEDKEEGKDEEEQKDEEEYEPDLDLEADFPQGEQEAGGGGRLRLCLVFLSSRQTVGGSLPLKARYGVNAWKRWAMSPDQSDDTKVKDSSKPGRSKSNLLSLSSEELNAALSRFVREVCRPGGSDTLRTASSTSAWGSSRWVPNQGNKTTETLQHKCSNSSRTAWLKTGEQESPKSSGGWFFSKKNHLHSKGRKDDLFSDPCYLLFGEELNKVLKDWQPSVLPDGSLWAGCRSRVCGAAGSSASRVRTPCCARWFTSTPNTWGCAPWSSTSACPSPTLQTTGKRKRSSEDGDQDFEADEDSGDSSARCPPVVVAGASRRLYVQPDPSCSPDDPLWFSSTPLERQILESLLTRVLLVRDVYTDTPHLEEEEGYQQQAKGQEVMKLCVLIIAPWMEDGAEEQFKSYFLQRVNKQRKGLVPPYEQMEEGISSHHPSLFLSVLLSGEPVFTTEDFEESDPRTVKRGLTVTLVLSVVRPSFINNLLHPSPLLNMKDRGEHSEM